MYIPKDLLLPCMNAIRKMSKAVAVINNLEPKVSQLSDQELRAKTEEFKSVIRKNNQDLISQIKDIKNKLKGSLEKQERELEAKNLK